MTGLSLINQFVGILKKTTGLTIMMDFIISLMDLLGASGLTGTNFPIKKIYIYILLV